VQTKLLLSPVPAAVLVKPLPFIWQINLFSGAGCPSSGKINALVDRIIQQGGKAIAVKADVTRQEEVQRAIDAAVAAYQRVDVLINNAGFMAIAPSAS
jgi:NAD(P)-dependent dehydrogenase (short-subunit alcohol dehydrogenase family)